MKIHIVASEHGGASFDIEAAYLDEGRAERRYITMTGADTLEEAVEQNQDAQMGDEQVFYLFSVDIEDFTPLPLFDHSLKEENARLLECIKDLEAGRE